jgi:hypothetical protein
MYSVLSCGLTGFLGAIIFLLVADELLVPLSQSSHGLLTQVLAIFLLKYVHFCEDFS